MTLTNCTRRVHVLTAFCGLTREYVGLSPAEGYSLHTVALLTGVSKTQ